ncbi:aminotransferase class I/II-fold pyridoxal phosphate-dependent enzyme [Streptomyces sioyaensis]|uniref:aminotransferase class I/II-fold pyridoxal phosphate-dependent enzyme n=1 Tax=Streptomyces sioyaensis TaxID=67364 RepID=UPI0033F81259
MFLPGASAVGLDYFGVQQQVSQFTTAVVYDRGGTGYSDPLPRPAAALATELHELLRVQNIAAPYVLVAHSLGGAYAHRFAQPYPQDVAGLVWLDAYHRDWDDFMPPASRLAAVEQMAPDLEQMRPSLREMFAELLADYPEHMRQALLEAKMSDEWTHVGIAERTELAELATELRAGPHIPDVPVVALSVVGTDPAQQAVTPEQTLREIHDGRKRMDAALVSAVSHGEQRILSDTSHHRLCFDRPDAVGRAPAPRAHAAAGIRTREPAEQDGTAPVPLGVGDCDLPTPPHIVEAMRQAVRDPSTHRYPPYAGTQAMREAAAGHLGRHFGRRLDPDTEVLATLGSKEAMAHLTMAYAEPGDVVLVPDPAYPVYGTWARFCGAEVVRVPLRESNGSCRTWPPSRPTPHAGPSCSGSATPTTPRPRWPLRTTTPSWRGSRYGMTSLIASDAAYSEIYTTALPRRRSSRHRARRSARPARPGGRLANPPGLMTTCVPPP